MEIIKASDTATRESRPDSSIVTRLVGRILLLTMTLVSAHSLAQGRDSEPLPEDPREFSLFGTVESGGSDEVDTRRARRGRSTTASNGPMGRR